MSTPTGSTNYYSFLDRTVAMRKVPPSGGAGTLYFLLSDQLGSVTGIRINNNPATIVSTTKYWPFGGIRASTGTLNTDKLFTGQQKETGDAALGLYNYDARFYSTTTGRFLSVDPIAGTPGDPQSWNPYAYVRNNPLGYTDPTGMYPGENLVEACKDLVKGVGGGIVSTYDAVTSTAGASLDAVTGGLDMGMNAVQACWDNEVCRGVGVTLAVAGCSALTSGAGTAACVAAGVVATSYDDAIDCAGGNASGCGAVAFNVGAEVLGAGAGKVGARLLEGRIGMALEGRLLQGIERFGVEGLTKKQAGGVALTGLRYGTHTGVSGLIRSRKKRSKEASF